MIPLLKEVLDAHGGLIRWKQFTKISATIRSGGDLWEMKGVPQDPSPRQMSASLDKEWSSVFPYGAPDKLTDFTANRVAIVTVDGRLVAERFDPAEHAEGKDTNAPWDALGSHVESLNAMPASSYPPTPPSHCIAILMSRAGRFLQCRDCLQ
jgi:hypothetical protein